MAQVDGKLRGPKLYPTVTKAWLDDIGVGRSTRVDYDGLMSRLQRRLPPDTRFAEITPEQIREFVDTGEAIRGRPAPPRSDRGRAHHLGLIHQIFDWASDPESGFEVDGNPAARLRAQARRSHRQPRDVNRRVWLSAAQAKALVATTRGDAEIDRRDAVMIVLYLSTGMRLTELIRIRWKQVDFSAGAHGTLVGVLRKGNKVTDVPLTSAAQRELFGWRARFIEAVGPDIGELSILPQARSMVVGNLMAKPQQRAVSLVWRRGITSGAAVRGRLMIRAQQAGISHLRPHDLRRTFAALLEDGGADLREIQAALAHANLATTERYLKRRTKLAPAAEALDFG
jgi:integrase